MELEELVEDGYVLWFHAHQLLSKHLHSSSLNSYSQMHYFC